MRALLVVAAACSIVTLIPLSGTHHARADQPPPTKGPAAGEDQAARGGKLYAHHCAKCHGDNGEGSKKAPPVVGKDALPLDPRPGQKVRKTQFHTAADVLAFISQKMPAKKPGSLKPTEYEDILAFDLKANGVDVSGVKIDASSAAGIVLHP